MIVSHIINIGPVFSFLHLFYSYLHLWFNSSVQFALPDIAWLSWGQHKCSNDIKMDNKNDITMIRMSYNNNTIVIQLNSNDLKITCEQQFQRIFHITMLKYWNIYEINWQNRIKTKFSHFIIGVFMVEFKRCLLPCHFLYSQCSVGWKLEKLCPWLKTVFYLSST